MNLNYINHFLLHHNNIQNVQKQLADIFWPLSFKRSVLLKGYPFKSHKKILIVNPLLSHVFNDEKQYTIFEIALANFCNQGISRFQSRGDNISDFCHR